MAEKHQDQDLFPDEVSKREKRKLRSSRQGHETVWFGLGMFGMVGWAVAIPTVVAIFIGVWIDFRWPSKYSWTLMLLLIGLLIGCLNAWYWVQRERDTITSERENEYE